MGGGSGLFHPVVVPLLTLGRTDQAIRADTEPIVDVAFASFETGGLLVIIRILLSITSRNWEAVSFQLAYVLQQAIRQIVSTVAVV